jgi:hypothetical protein
MHTSISSPIYSTLKHIGIFDWASLRRVKTNEWAIDYSVLMPLSPTIEKLNQKKYFFTIAIWKILVIPKNEDFEGNM